MIFLALGHACHARAIRREMADSNDDSNRSSQWLSAATGDDPERSHDGASTGRTPRLKSGESVPSHPSGRVNVQEWANSASAPWGLSIPRIRQILGWLFLCKQLLSDAQVGAPW